MGDRQKCDEHGYVEATEMRNCGGVLVHMLDPWHTAIKARAIRMDGSDPVLDASGRPIVESVAFEPSYDKPPDDLG